MATTGTRTEGADISPISTLRLMARATFTSTCKCADVSTRLDSERGLFRTPELHAAVDGARHHHHHLRRRQEELNTGLDSNSKAALMSTPRLMKHATFTSTCVGVMKRVHMDLK